MGLIQSVLHFVLCPKCRKHGHFVTPGLIGVTGCEVYSVEAAIIHLDIILEMGLADELEVRLAREQVKASPLPLESTPEDSRDDSEETPSPLNVQQLRSRYREFEIGPQSLN